MSDERIISVLREQAWQRAKGELGAMVAAIWAGRSRAEPLSDRDFDAVEAIDSFIDDIEGTEAHYADLRTEGGKK